MEALISMLAVLAGAGAVGLGLAAFAVGRLKRSTGITIERGKPQEPAGDAYFSRYA